MIDIAKLLKDAPRGMKLYSPIFGEVEFAEVHLDKSGYPIEVLCGSDNETFDSYGRYTSQFPNAECLLFPSKEVRTWENFKLPVQSNFKVGDWVVGKDGKPFSSHNYAEQITLIEDDGKHKRIWLSSKTWAEDDYIRLWTIEDAKDGDVLVTTNVRSCPFIYRKTDYNDNLAYYYAGIDGNGNFCEGCLKRTLFHFGSVKNVVPATKEQRDLLFAKMKDAGYEWDADKKELRKIKPHYDIDNFKPKQWVLVRDDDEREWALTRFSYLSNGSASLFVCINGASFQQCIPFDGNEKLLGTTDMPSEEYINW